jgi:hypothetical protein
LLGDLTGGGKTLAWYQTRFRDGLWKGEVDKESGWLKGVKEGKMCFCGGLSMDMSLTMAAGEAS